MSRKTLRTAAAVLVLLATVGAFVYYAHSHPEVLRQIGRTPLWLIAVLLLLFSVQLLCLAWIQTATLRLCGIRLGPRESTLLIMYSSIINFFGPLQSGPAFRAVYLKRRHNVNLKKYAAATLLYYGFYALFSGLLIASYVVGIWSLIAAGACLLLVPFAARQSSLLPARLRGLELKHIGNLALGTLGQVLTLAGIYDVELRTLGHHITTVAALIYSGAANLALFVSITPGAIGFREAFIVFTERLHHIPGSLIASANLVDRATYILFLGILAVLVFGLHAERHLKRDLQ